MIATQITLWCGSCALELCELDVTIDSDGRLPSQVGSGQIKSDQIYNPARGPNLLPAVPCDYGSSFWGYTSVPDDGVEWWRALPLRSV